MSIVSVGRQRWSVCRGFHRVLSLCRQLYRPTLVYGAYGVVTGNYSIYGNNAISKVVFPSVILTVMLNKFEFVTSIVGANHSIVP